MTVNTTAPANRHGEQGPAQGHHATTRTPRGPASPRGLTPVAGAQPPCRTRPRPHPTHDQVTKGEQGRIRMPNRGKMRPNHKGEGSQGEPSTLTVGRHGAAGLPHPFPLDCKGLTVNVEYHP